MTEPESQSLTLACVADESTTAAVLHEALAGLFPHATVTRVDTGAERTLPPTIDCAVVDATVRGEDGIDVLRRLRARGYAGAAVLMIDGVRSAVDDDVASARRLGAWSCSFDAPFSVPLGEAVVAALRANDATAEDRSSQAMSALRHNQRMLAAGELAIRLQHSLNNPLAALLAEAQLLELEELAPEHEASVKRIIELTRRVVEVVRGLDGVARA